MTFRVLVDDRAQRDFEAIEQFLDTHAPDQTARFIDDFEAALRRIAAHALMRREVRPGVRRESLRVFRYQLWYRVLPEIQHVEVFAVLHHRRGSAALDRRSD